MPGLFEQFPHTNLHELNLDWIIDLLNQFKEELEDSAVLSVNGQTGHVTLYESENVILPALPEGVNQWRLVRMMNGQYAGILFYNGNVYLQRGNSTMRLLTLEDIPTSAGVVAWNGRTGIVNVTGMDIPVDDAADADSIEQAITNEHTERVNADNALQNSIDAINQAITPATLECTINSQITNVARFSCVKIGKVIYIEAVLGFSSSMVFSANDPIITITGVEFKNFIDVWMTNETTGISELKLYGRQNRNILEFNRTISGIPNAFLDLMVAIPIN